MLFNGGLSRSRLKWEPLDVARVFSLPSNSRCNSMIQNANNCLDKDQPRGLLRVIAGGVNKSKTKGFINDTPTEVGP